MQTRTGPRLLVSPPSRHGAAAGRPGHERAPRLMHVFTVPESLLFVSGQLKHLRSSGFEVHAVASPGPFLSEIAAAEGATSRAIRMHRKITPVRDVLSLAQLFAEVRRFRPDIVHGHTPKGGLLSMLAAFAAGTPVRVYTIHGLPFLTATGTRRALLKATERISCALATRVLAVSKSMGRAAVEHGLCPPAKVATLADGTSNGVDGKERFRPQPSDVRRETRRAYGISDEAFVIGFVGRLAREKGVVELATAWRLVRERAPNAVLLIVGPWEDNDPIPLATRRHLQRDSRVRLLGTDWDTPRLYAAMDLVVLPTYREGFPNVPLEAAAMGLPVVATDVPGCTDAVVDGSTGTLVPVRDAPALAKAIETYINDGALGRRHGSAARQRVLRDFTPQRLRLETTAEYRRLLEASRQHVERVNMRLR